MKCSGVIFVTEGGNALFLKRSAQGDHEGEWDFPGGKIEDGETPQKCAIRETKEETGHRLKGDLVEANRTITTIEGDDQTTTREIDFITYTNLIEFEFIPLLNDEHTEFIWAPLESPPSPLHPGVQVTLSKLGSDELGIAEMMERGEIVSPQRYMNIWLFDIRITGTGLAYRSGPDEYVWRDKELYLNERFLKRCYGLPVIMEHPVTATLNTKEFVDRNIGTVFIPYIKGDDVWAIVKIYDQFAAKIMSENILSTSPAVVLYGDEKAYKTHDNKKLLIEDVPRLLDHIAICFNGVWDVGGPPTGVNSTTAKELVMADNDDKAAALEAARKNDEAKAKADAEAKAKKDADEAEFAAQGGGGTAEVLDKTLKCLDSITARMDAWDNEDKEKEKKKADRQAKKDAEAKEKADADIKAKSDSAEKEKADAEAKAKADAEAAAKAKADSESDVRKRIADVEARLPKQMTDADYAVMADSQAKADRIYLMHSKRSPRPFDGESLFGYRRRIATDLKAHSPAWKDVDLRAIADEAAFENIEKMIYADATNAALHPIEPGEDYLREIVEEDVTGRKISTFVGRPTAWLSQFATNKRRVVGIRNHT